MYDVSFILLLGVENVNGLYSGASQNSDCLRKEAIICLASQSALLFFFGTDVKMCVCVCVLWLCVVMGVSRDRPFVCGENFAVGIIQATVEVISWHCVILTCIGIDLFVQVSRQPVSMARACFQGSPNKQIPYCNTRNIQLHFCVWKSSLALSRWAEAFYDW